MVDPHEIVSVNRAELLALTAGGDLCAFSTMLDDDGDETDDAITAAVVIVKRPDQKFAVVDLREFEPATEN